MRAKSAMLLRNVAPRTTISARPARPRALNIRQIMYNKLKRIIPGTTKTTPLDMLEFKLEEARSNPDMVALISKFTYEEICEVAKEFVAEGLLDFAQPPDGYVSASKAAREAAIQASTVTDVPDESRGYDSRRLEAIQSAVTKDELPISTSGTGVTGFDQLLKDHLEVYKAASVKPAEVIESTRSNPLLNAEGRYLETCVEELYQLLKPHLKGMPYRKPGAFRIMKDVLRSAFEHELKEPGLKYGQGSVVRLTYDLAMRGLFLVDFDTFPTYREAAEEARRLVPKYADWPLWTDAITSEDASQSPSPYPWESVRLPHMHDIEPPANRHTIPDFQRPRLLPAPRVLQGLKTNEGSEVTETERMQISFSKESASDLKQTTDPKPAGLQIPHPGIPETSEQALDQSGYSDSAALTEPDVTPYDRFDEPSNILRVAGFSSRVTKRLLFKKFAEYSPVKVDFVARHVAYITFTDIEAATKALHARQCTLLGGRALSCCFMQDKSRKNHVMDRDVASGQSVNHHMFDLPSLPADTWHEHPSAAFVSVKGEAVTRAPTHKTVEAVSKAPTQSIADNTLLSSSSQSPQLIQMALEPAPAISDDCETDEGMMSTEPSASDPPGPSSRWDKLLNYRDLRKGTNIDPVDSEISRHATMAVPETRSFYLPHYVQHKILCSLQVSLEKICFEYIMRTTPKVLQETQNQWGIDNPHALELSQYMILFDKLNVFGNKPGALDDDQSMWELRQSLILLRHAAVHRKRSSVPSLRQWAHDAYTLATIVGDSRASVQFETLQRYLEVEEQRMYSERKEVEERLLVTVKELAAKRAELNRLEREAMDRFSEEHKQIHARDSAYLSKAVDATLSVENGPEIGFEEISSTEPSSPTELTSATETASPIVPATSPTEPSSWTIEPTISPIVPTTLPIMPTALSVGPTILPTAPLSLVPQGISTTDPVSGIFGRLKLWYGA